MVTPLLQDLGKSIFNILESSIEKKQENQASESGVFLFFSFDLVNSTSFKAEHPSLWSSVFTCFYGQVLENLGIENYKTPNDADDAVCVRKLWKLIGDEVLVYVQIKELGQLYTQITSAAKALDKLMANIAETVQKDAQEGICCAEHCQDVGKVITSSLGIKAAAWLAECYRGADAKASNIIYCPVTTTFSDKRIDFLGKEIDEGFRISKYAVKNKIIISPLLAWLIWKKAKEDEDEAKIVRANFKITAFAAMKGVWRNRKVPLVMFHQSFEHFMDVLEYDELDLDIYSNVKEAGVENFFKDKRFEIDRIDRILENVHKKGEAEKLYKKLKNTSDIEIVPNNIDRKQEFHIACLIFDKDNRILIHEDADRGYEFGCIKRTYGLGMRNWKSICEEGYKDKYNIKIKVEEYPVPVATYYYGKSNACGLIVMADFDGECEEIDERNDWNFYEFEEIQKSTQKSVDNFEENINMAMRLRKWTVEKHDGI